MAALRVISERPDKIVIGKGGGNAAGTLVALVIFAVVTIIALGALLGDGGEINPVMIIIFLVIGFALLNSFAKTLASTRVVLDAGQRIATRVETILLLPVRRQEMAVNLIRDVQVTRLPGSGSFSLDSLPIWQVQLQATDGTVLVVNERGTRGEMDAIAQKVGTLLGRPVRGENETKPLPQMAGGPDTVTYTPAAVVTSLFQNLADFAQSATVATYTPTVAAPGTSPRLRQDEMERAPRGQRRRREKTPPAPPNTLTPTTTPFDREERYIEASPKPGTGPTSLPTIAEPVAMFSALADTNLASLTFASPTSSALNMTYGAYSAPAVLVMPELPGMMSFAPALEMPSFPPIGSSMPPQMTTLMQEPEIKVVEAKVTPVASIVNDTGSESWTLYRAARKQHALRNFREAQATYLRALSANPADALIQNDLGVTYYEQNKLQDAERTFRRAIALDPFAVTSRYNLGMVLQRQGRRNEAREQFQLGAQGASQSDAQYFQDAMRGSMRSPLLGPQP